VITTLRPNDRRVLELVGRVRFCTQDQISRYLDMSRALVTRHLSQLEKGGLVDRDSNIRPHIFWLTTKGARVMDIKLSGAKRMHSYHVRRHYCHRNEFELQSLEHNPHFKYLSRNELLAHGLYPSHAEHAAAEQLLDYSLILIDDYLMNSDRILVSWTRQHLKNSRSKALAGKPVRRWYNVTNRLTVVSTDSINLQKHKRYCDKLTELKHRLEQQPGLSTAFDKKNVRAFIQPDFVYLEPLWVVS